MSILIEGMEMPTKENAVILITPSGDVWMIGDMPNEDTHLVKAKAFHVPEPHGRLIDADAFTKDECINCDGACEALPCDCLDCESDCRCDFMKDIGAAPTVIQASEEAE